MKLDKIELSDWYLSSFRNQYRRCWINDPTYQNDIVLICYYTGSIWVSFFYGPLAKFNDLYHEEDINPQIVMTGIDRFLERINKIMVFE